MVKINKPLLPIKAHYFFFMAAMGPILPQLSVLGKQIGVAPEIMGFVTSVLPIMYVIAKPLFGFVADYFTSFRKGVFITLIIFMTLSYGAFYFIPNTTNHALDVNAKWHMILDTNTSLPICSDEVTTRLALCSKSREATCSDNKTSFNAFITADAEQINTNFCLRANALLPLDNSNVSCYYPADLQLDCLYGTSTFWLFVLFLCLGTIGFNVTNSISDVICFDMLGETQEHKYGAQRVWGTLGFGATALLAGIAVDWWTENEVKSFTPALLIMLIFSGFDLLSVSKLQLPKLSTSESIFKDVWGLMKQTPIATFLIFATIAGILDSFIIYFMFWHLEDVAAATGYMPQIKLIEGCVVAAECLAGEVPFFFYSGKIIKKLGYVNCMTMCFFFYAVRLALISWIPNPWYLVGVELFLQGCTYALCYTCIVAYASAVAPPGTSATVQGLMAGMDDGLGFCIGSFIGGLSYKRFGGRRSFMYFSLLAIGTCIAHILIRPTSRKQKSQVTKAGYELPTEQELLELRKTAQVL